MKEDNIDIVSFDEINSEYKIYPKKEIDGKTINIVYEYDLSNVSEKDGLTLIIMHHTTKINPKFIKYNKFICRIIKFLPENKYINTNVEIKQEKVFEYYPNFFQYDIFRVNDKISFLFIFLFNEFYSYKIIEKEDGDEKKLEYVELNIPSNDKIEKNIIRLFVGNSLYENNILEYIFLEKPSNNFLYFVFNLNSLEIETKEIECKIIYRSLDKSYLEKYKLNRLRKGLNNDKFIFIENESFQIISKDDNNNSRMLIYPLEFIYKQNKIFPQKIFMCKILNKIYFIIDTTNLDSSTSNKNVITLSIFELIFDEENEVYRTKLIQEIKIKINSKDGKYNLNCVLNKITIVDDNTITYIILNNNCLAKSVYLFNKILQKKYYLNNDEKFFHIYVIAQGEKYISWMQIDKEQEQDEIKQEINQNNTFDSISNNVSIEINNDNINSIIKNKLMYLMNSKRETLEKNYIKIKDKISGEKIETEKNEKRLEKLSIQAVEDIEDIKDEKKLSQTQSSNLKEKKPYYNNYYKNENKNEQNWSYNNKLNYQNKKYKNKNYYNNNNYHNNKNYNNNYNRMNNRINNNQMNKNNQNQINNQLNNQMNINMNQPNYNMNNNNFRFNNNAGNNYMKNNFNNNQYNVNNQSIKLIQEMNKLNPNNQYQMNPLNQMNNIPNQSYNNHFNNNPQMFQNNFYNHK